MSFIKLITEWHMPENAKPTSDDLSKKFGGPCERKRERNRGQLWHLVLQMTVLWPDGPCQTHFTNVHPTLSTRNLHSYYISLYTCILHIISRSHMYQLFYYFYPMVLKWLWAYLVKFTTNSVACNVSKTGCVERDM